MFYIDQMTKRLPCLSETFKPKYAKVFDYILCTMQAAHDKP